MPISWSYSTVVECLPEQAQNPWLNSKHYQKGKYDEPLGIMVYQVVPVTHKAYSGKAT